LSSLFLPNLDSIGPCPTVTNNLPNCSELKIVSGAGHGVIVEKPDETAKLVLDFLAR
jgi:pimeloyl-ACP methyl ester carboxylesterase